MSTSIVSFDFKGSGVRTVTGSDGSIWFVASDIAKLLDYADAHSMTRTLDEDEKGTVQCVVHYKTQEVITISEPGLYMAIEMMSRCSSLKRVGRYFVKC